MADIDRAVEIATQQDFIAFTEGPHPYPTDYEPEPLICPSCGDSTQHPRWRDSYADDVRMIGQPLTGWHNDCAESEEAAQAEARVALVAERDAILATLASVAREGLRL